MKDLYKDISDKELAGLIKEHPALQKKTRAGLKKQPVDNEGGQDEWLITYADAMTLILAFFILILSISEIKQDKFETLQTNLGQGLLKKEKVVNPLQNLESALSNVLENNQINPAEAMTLNENELRIDLPGELLFEVGSTNLEPKSEQLITALAKEIKAFPLHNYLIEIEGHTDDTPIHSIRFPSNWELSSGRAISVLKVFFNTGINKQRLKAIGYADTRPKKPNRTKKGIAIPSNQATNRRVEIKVSKSSTGALKSPEHRRAP
ncbi:MAG: cell envelope biogenesis protein OmpA [Thiomicrospira sp.]|nr:MAG: cell envelope biogenesis protein OmpA [Thiomicrospira sp.]